jgi:eukaryotic-like serine/threonine-protein kinase
MSAMGAMPEPAEVRPGTRLGRYEVLIGIAQGGMARVWAAHQQGHRGFSKIVAVKTILPALTSDPSFEEMFLDEARVAASVHHPNVCQIFDLGEENEILYLAMEWVNGESLARVLKPPKQGAEKSAPQRLNARVAARIVADAAAGLHAAHELCDDSGQKLNVVHRDVSPQNILISMTGNVKVTDFGVAKALGMSHEATMAGQVKGKAAYMSPEQASGSRVDRRSDIFALGIVLYEITTGKRPFQGENQVATLKQLLEGSFQPPSALVAGYPRELEAIVMRALSADPGGRHPTADRMRIAIEEWLARSGPVVTETQVGALVRKRVGAIVDERQQRIRERMKAPAGQPPAPAHAFTPSAPSDASSSKISAPSHPSHVSHVSQVSPVSRSGPALAPAPISVPSSPTAASQPSGISQPSGMNYPSVISEVSAPYAAAPPVVPTYSPPLAPPARSGGSNPALLGIGIGVAIFLAVAVAGAGFFLLRSGKPPAPTAAEPAATEEPAAAETPAATAAPAPPAEAKLEKIQIQSVEPASGIEFELDGKPLAAGITTIERPPAGKFKLLKAIAKGYEPDVFRIDDATSDTLEVLLVKKTAEAVKKEPAAPAAAPAPQPVQPPPKKKPVMRPDIPENPF